MAESTSFPLEQFAHAADLCLVPWRHAVRICEPEGLERSATDADGPLDCVLRLEARAASGERQPAHDLELEIYRSGRALNLLLSRPADAGAPLLWHGNHPVWLCPESGMRRERPADGLPLEALGRRLRALLAGGWEPEG
jgi:hypothetical protein